MPFISYDEGDIFSGTMAQYTLAASNLMIIKDENADVLKWHLMLAFIILNNQLFQMRPEISLRRNF